MCVCVCVFYYFVVGFCISLDLYNFFFLRTWIIHKNVKLFVFLICFYEILAQVDLKFTLGEDKTTVYSNISVFPRIEGMC